MRMMFIFQFVTFDEYSFFITICRERVSLLTVMHFSSTYNLCRCCTLGPLVNTGCFEHDRILYSLDAIVPNETVCQNDAFDPGERNALELVHKSSMIDNMYDGELGYTCGMQPKDAW